MEELCRSVLQRLRGEARTGLRTLQRSIAKPSFVPDPFLDSSRFAYHIWGLSTQGRLSRGPERETEAFALAARGIGRFTEGLPQCRAFPCYRARCCWVLRKWNG